jgi:hypothetical protein
LRKISYAVIAVKARKMRAIGSDAPPSAQVASMANRQRRASPPGDRRRRARSAGGWRRSLAVAGSGGRRSKFSAAVQLLMRLISARTRAGSTGWWTWPATFSEVPTIRPSAQPSKSWAVSALTPLPM